VKTRRLSEIDLARLASLSDQAALEHALRGYNAGGGAWSYDPVRASTSEIVAASTPLLGVLPPVSWAKIERQIIAASWRGEVQAVANALVGKVLFDATRRLGWSAVKFPMGRLPIGIGESVRFWSDVVLEDADGLIIPFFDHRREHGIANPAMRQIVFSMQHIWIRDRHPDLGQARLATVQFPTAGETRSIRVESHSEADLLPYDVLDARVRNVYETWARVSAEKARDGLMTGTGGGNPFGF
jgi:hypothetical protein